MLNLTRVELLNYAWVFFHLQLKLVDIQMSISMTENVSGVKILFKMSFSLPVIILCTVI